MLLATASHGLRIVRAAISARRRPSQSPCAISSSRGSVSSASPALRRAGARFRAARKRACNHTRNRLVAQRARKRLRLRAAGVGQLRLQAGLDSVLRDSNPSRRDARRRSQRRRRARRSCRRSQRSGSSDRRAAISRSTSSTIIASPPRCVRATCIVEMLTLASPQIVPMRPTMPGTSRWRVTTIAPCGDRVDLEAVDLDDARSVRQHRADRRDGRRLRRRSTSETASRPLSRETSARTPISARDRARVDQRHAPIGHQRQRAREQRGDERLGVVRLRSRRATRARSRRAARLRRVAARACPRRCARSMNAPARCACAPCEHRSVDGARCRPPAEHAHDVAREFERDALERFVGRAAQMRRGDHALVRRACAPTPIPPAAALRARRRPRPRASRPASSASSKRVGVDDGAARAVDEHRVVTHQSQARGRRSSCASAR